MQSIRLLALVGLLFARAGAATLVAQAAPSAVSEPLLRPGDAVQITVFRQPELSGEFTLGATGAIDHPLYQEVVVAGVPLKTARERLRTYLLDWEADPHFLLKPLFRVAVGGEVTRPNLYTFAPEMTIAQAVAAAGGVTEGGRLEAVRVLRDGEELLVDLTASGGGGLQMTVRSGDQILVTRSRSEFFRDYVAPAGSLIMAGVTLVSILVR